MATTTTKPIKLPLGIGQRKLGEYHLEEGIKITTTDSDIIPKQMLGNLQLTYRSLKDDNERLRNQPWYLFRVWVNISEFQHNAKQFHKAAKRVSDAARDAKIAEMRATRSIIVEAPLYSNDPTTGHSGNSQSEESLSSDSSSIEQTSFAILGSFKTDSAGTISLVDKKAVRVEDPDTRPDPLGSGNYIGASRPPSPTEDGISLRVYPAEILERIERPPSFSDSIFAHDNQSESSLEPTPCTTYLDDFSSFISLPAVSYLSDSDS